MKTLALALALASALVALGCAHGDGGVDPARPEAGTPPAGATPAVPPPPSGPGADPSAGVPVPLAGADALPPCAPNVSWRSVRASAFSLEVPCDFLKKPVQGIDSEVGMMESPTMVLSFDHGGYSSTLREFDSWPELRSEQASIGGKDARIITFRGTGDQWASHPFGAAVHFPDVGASPQGKAKLTILVKGKSATDQATATRIFRSVRFQ